MDMMGAWVFGDVVHGDAMVGDDGWLDMDAWIWMLGYGCLNAWIWMLGNGCLDAWVLEDDGYLDAWMLGYGCLDTDAWKWMLGNGCLDAWMLLLLTHSFLHAAMRRFSLVLVLVFDFPKSLVLVGYYYTAEYIYLALDILADGLHRDRSIA